MFRQSYLIWLFPILPIFMEFTLIPRLVLNNENIIFIIIANVFFGIVTIPGIRLYYNYRRFSINKEFVITYNTIKLVDTATNSIIELNINDIETIELHTNELATKLPWSFYRYFCFTDKFKKRIVVTSFIMDISDLWMDSLARKISSEKFKRIDSTYSIIAR